MEERDDSIATRRLVLAACAAGFFWIFAVNVLTGFLDFVTKRGVGSRSGLVAGIDDTIDDVLVASLGSPLAAGTLFLSGLGAAWLVGRTPRQPRESAVRPDVAGATVAPAHSATPSMTGFGKRVAALTRAAPVGQGTAVRSDVWLSGILGNHDIGMKQGTRTKFYGHEWTPASLIIPVEPDEVYAARARYIQGFALRRSEFPEAIAVFDERRFAKVKEIFYAGPFLAVEGKLAEALSRFDLGEGGLIPFTIYRADLTTPVDRQVFLLNFGARKDSILPERCQDAQTFLIDKSTGRQVWHINKLNVDGEVALSSAALDGPDLWFEEAVSERIFMKDALAQALLEIGMGDVFKLKPCSITNGDRG